MPERWFQGPWNLSLLNVTHSFTVSEAVEEDEAEQGQPNPRAAITAAQHCGPRAVTSDAACEPQSEHSISVSWASGYGAIAGQLRLAGHLSFQDGQQGWAVVN